MAAEASTAPTGPQPISKFIGTVKQVLDGGVIIVKGQPRNGPPPERTLVLADLDAVPRMARRPTPNNPTPTPLEDEPLAWESREFLRKLLVGKAVTGLVLRVDPNTQREYGSVYLGPDPETAENVSVSLVKEGLAKVRQMSQDQTLKAAEKEAQDAEKGLWAKDASTHVRNVTWEVPDARQLVEQYRGRRIKAVVENVRDGSTVRAFLLPDFYHVTIMLSGVRTPRCETGEKGLPVAAGSEPYGLEAQYFTETKLLQQEVEVILESCNKANNMLIGSVIHPMGNIAEALLRFGYAKIVDWSLKVIAEGSEKYRAAEKAAKEKRLKQWENWAPPTGPDLNQKDKLYTGKVVEVVNGDALMVKRGKGDVRKVHLASIRPPRLAEGADRPNNFRALYDIPHMFEAREFLRKKLIGHNVQVIVDYVQPANESFPEKTCATVMAGDVNVAEALVARGLATVVIHGQNQDARSSRYDDLMIAEEKAKKSSNGLHNKKPSTARRIADISGEKSKQFLPFLQRAGRMQAVVEFVASASRYRLYIPRETCVITFLLSGIQCPRGERVMPGGTVVPAEPFGNEAHSFVKEMILQREVDIQVEGMDKGGNFIGWCFEGSTNLSLALVDEGFASSFIMGDKSGYGNQIIMAEEAAKKKKIKRWANYVEEEPSVEGENGSGDADDLATSKEIDGDRKVNYVSAVVTEITPEAKIYVNHVDDGKDLEKMMGELRAEFVSNPPLGGAFQPKRGDLCAAKFVDGDWYRAKVEKVNMKEGTASVLYVDYGNRADIPKGQTASLPGAFTAIPHFAHEYSLALCQLARDEEYAEIGLKALSDDLLNRQVKVNVEYKTGGISFVSILDGNDADVGKGLIREGLLMAEKKGGRRVAKLVDSYLEAMSQAKKEHLNIWRYGDITEDDAREFGVGGQR